MQIDPQQLRHALAYDTYVAKRLTTFQRMAVNQIIAGHAKPNSALKQLLKTLQQEAAGWEAPTVRYNADRELEVCELETGSWKLLNTN